MNSLEIVQNDFVHDMKGRLRPFIGIGNKSRLLMQLDINRAKGAFYGAIHGYDKTIADRHSKIINVSLVDRIWETIKEKIDHENQNTR